MISRNALLQEVIRTAHSSRGIPLEEEGAAIIPVMIRLDRSLSRILD